MARDCAVCGDLTCDCPNHYNPQTDHGIGIRFGICESCRTDLVQRVGEVRIGRIGNDSEGVGYVRTTTDTRRRVNRVQDWLITNRLPQRKPTRNTTQPMRAGVSS